MLTTVDYARIATKVYDIGTTAGRAGDGIAA